MMSSSAGVSTRALSVDSIGGGQGGVQKRASSAGSNKGNKTTTINDQMARGSSKSRIKNQPIKEFNHGDLNDGVRVKLHHLFDQIEKEFDILFAENVSLKERVDTLEEVLMSSSGVGTPPSDSTNSKPLLQKLQGSHHGNLKRDSMVSASQISQKIKSTYKLKASGRIFNKTQSNIRCQLLGKYEWHKDGVWSVSTINKHGKLLIGTASADGSACICDLNSGSLVKPQIVYLGHHGCSVNCIRFHPNHDLVLTVAGDSGAHIWRPTFDQRSSDEDSVDHSSDESQYIKQPLLDLSGHTSVVISCDWLSTVDQCVTASWDRTANIYDIRTGELVVQLAGHDQELTDISAHTSTPLIVTSSYDTTFRLWDFREAIHSVCVFQGHAECVTSASFLGSDKVISGADDRTVKVWDLKNMRSPLTSICVESPINKLGVSQQHNIIAIPMENRHVRMFDVNGNRICRLPRNYYERMVTCAAFVPTGQPTTGQALASNPIQLLTCAFDRKVCWWSITPNEHKS